MARPKLDIDSVQVKKLAIMQCTNVEIAAFFDCDEATIRKRFSDILTKGREVGKITLRRKQWQVALSGNVALLIFLGKQYLGQSDKNEIGGKDGNPIAFDVRLKKFDDDGKD